MSLGSVNALAKKEECMESLSLISQNPSTPQQYYGPCSLPTPIAKHGKEAEEDIVLLAATLSATAAVREINH
jgi:hypothetical protein